MLNIRQNVNNNLSSLTFAGSQFRLTELMTKRNVKTGGRKKGHTEVRQ